MTPFTSLSLDSIPITIISAKDFPKWLKSKDELTQKWLENHDFKAENGTSILIRNAEGKPLEVIAGLSEDFWNYSHLATTLPAGTYHLENLTLTQQQANYACLAWGLAHYKFDKYKNSSLNKITQLVWPEQAHKDWVETALASIYQARDLINTPAEDLTPMDLAETVKDLAKTYKAKVQIIKGKDLKENYPAIYTVGKAATAEPCFIELEWTHPHAVRSLTLVGKGVTFDSGGLDIKPSSGMLTMKKDMGGAAYVITLARLIMHLNYPLKLRLFVPAVENAISGNAMRPMDIIRTRKGTTVEVGNTDAEGRLILADALTRAAAESPDLIIDCATLTGAARIALGTELPAVFSNNEKIVSQLLNIGKEINDPMWQLPLFAPYRRFLKTNIADLSSVAKHGYGGAIVAALFLEHFVEGSPWIHIDTMAWNTGSLPGRPEGGEVMGWLSLAEFISQWAS